MEIEVAKQDVARAYQQLMDKKSAEIRHLRDALQEIYDLGELLQPPVAQAIARAALAELSQVAQRHARMLEEEAPPAAGLLRAAQEHARFLNAGDSAALDQDKTGA
jgi:hypothetical protein